MLRVLTFRLHSINGRPLTSRITSGKQIFSFITKNSSCYCIEMISQSCFFLLDSIFALVASGSTDSGNQQTDPMNSFHLSAQS